MEENQHQYLNSITEMFLDQIVDEIQERKVDYNLTGYINLIKSDNTNEDMALMFFEALSQISDLDIRVLRLYSFDSEETANDIVNLFCVRK